MPANTQTIDWSGIRAAAVALQSVRLAATKACEHLPAIEQSRFIERVNKRAYRERWLDKHQALVQSRTNGCKPLSKPVQTGAQSVQSSIADTGREIRTHLARIALASAKRTKRVPLRTMKDLRDAAQATQVIDPQGEERSVITLNVLNVRGDMHTQG